MKRVYSSPDDRFYVEIDNRVCAFVVRDAERPSVRTIVNRQREAIAVCDRYYREALNEV